MQNLKKLLAMTLALAMSIMIFAACGNKDGGDTETNSNNAAAEVEEVVDGFLSAVTTFELSRSLNYIDGNSDFYNDYFSDLISGFGLDAADIDRDFDFKAYINASFAEMFDGLDFLNDDISDFVDGLVDLILENCSYEIKAIEVDGDRATAAISITIPDMDAIDFDEIAENASGALNFNEDTLGEEFLRYVLDKLGTDDIDALNYISEDDFATYLTSFLQDSGIISNMFDYMLDEVKAQLGTSTENGELELERINGDWLIVGEN